MAVFSHSNEIDLEQRISALSTELAGLKRTIARRGNGYLEDGRDVAADVYSDIAGRVGRGLPFVRKRARMVEATAREHPAAAAAVGLVVLGLVATLALGRR